ncbi:hypothetical protein IKF03_02700 [Candidatus Saccharibacteria bacterium]|nr:hypothetical protein [Candidatus Saccharibacteria bacterium]
MGEIVDFRSNRSTRMFRKKFNIGRSVTNVSRALAYRNNNPERWRSMEERTRLTNVDETTPSIDYAIGRFKWWLDNKLSVDRSLFPKDLFELRLTKNTLSANAAYVIGRLDKNVRAEIVFEMLEAIHDGWVSDQSADFFSYFLDREYYYLPIELIGVGRLEPHYQAFSPHLDVFGLEAVSWDDVLGVYERRRRAFVKKYKIKNPNDLTRLITKMGKIYLALTPEVAGAMANKVLAFDIMRQVVTRSPELLSAV